MERIAILAGSGQLPIAIAKSIVARGGHVHLVAIGDGADPEISKFPHTVVGWGRVGALLTALRKNGEAIVIAGAVRRPDLGRMKPDLGFVRYLPDILSMLKGGDDAILTRVVRFFERQGFVVKGVADVAPELMAEHGHIAGPTIASATENDVRIGLNVLEALSGLDIGQAIVVANGRILAIEGAEGTDRMLARLRRASDAVATSPQGALIKAPKRGQELRIDLPTIGTATVAHAAAANLAAIAIHTGHSLVLDSDQLAIDAELAGLTVLGVLPDPSTTAPIRRITMDPEAWRGATLGRIVPTDADRVDAAKAAETCARLAPYNAGAAVAVVRHHVLAVAAIEAPAVMAQRLVDLRQWGSRSNRRRKGAIAVRLDELDQAGAEAIIADLITATAKSAFAGIALIHGNASRSNTATLASHIITAADREGLFLIAITRKSQSALSSAVGGDGRGIPA